MAHTQLYQLIDDSFNMQELDELCQAYGWDIQNLGGDTKRGKALELQKHAKRHLREAELVQAIAAMRPDLNLRLWGGSAPATVPSPQPAPPSPDLYHALSMGSLGVNTSQDPAHKPAFSPHAPIAYENFDLRIGAAISGQFPVEVVESPVGQTRQPVLQAFPLEDATFQAQLALLQARKARAAEVQQLGRQLRSLLFPGEVWNLFFASQDKMTAAGKGLRVRLRIAPPELSRLPWEYCHDETFSFLALRRETPLVRFIAEPFAAEQLAAPNPLRLLVAVASPKELPELRVDEEVARIEQALAKLAGQVQLTVVRGTTPQKLQDALIVHRPHVLHFVGHGIVNEEGMGTLALEDDFGDGLLLDAEQLLVLMGGRGVKLAVLNACQTAQPEQGAAIMGVAPALVRAQIPAVVAMQFAVPDKTALLFTRQLYTTLAAGLPLDTAVTEMRIAAFINGNDKLHWGIPTLFMRAPDGVLWQPRAASGERGARSGVNFSNISGGSISIGGDVVGGNKTS